MLRCRETWHEMIHTAEIERHEALRFIQAWRLQRTAGASLVTADAPWSPTMGLLLGTVVPKSCTVAVWEGRRAVALAQLAGQSRREQWELMYVAVAGLRREAPIATEAVSARLLPLLDEVCRIAGAKHITNVVARVPARGWIAATFHARGFPL